MFSLKNVIRVFIFCILVCEGLTACSQTTDLSIESNVEAFPTATFTKQSSVLNTPKDNSNSKRTEAPMLTPTQSGPDLSGKQVVVYHMGGTADDYSNVLVLPMINGVKDIVAQINKSGGVFGARLALRFIDTEGLPERAIAAYKDLKENDEEILVLLTYSMEETEALAPLAVQDNVALITAFPSEKALYGIENSTVFSLASTPGEELAFFVDYLIEDWEVIRPFGATDEIKLGLIHWPGQFGKALLDKTLLEYIESKGIEVVAMEEIEISPFSNSVNAIMAARIAKANVLYLQTASFGAANVLNDLHNLAIKDDFVIGATMHAVDLPTHLYLADPSYSNSVYVPFPCAWWYDQGNPAIDYAWANFESSIRDQEQLTMGRLLMQGSVDLIKYAIETAIIEAGFDSLSSADVLDALLAIEGYDVLGGLTTVSFSEMNHSAKLMNVRVILEGPETAYIIRDFRPVPDLWSK
jgi:branched-chain amino acid transport system substrate-binding protein